MRWLLAIAMLIVPFQVLAQEAPTGEHYAGRPTDTGFGGTRVTATGAFPASVPLDLPAARGDLPVPLQIVYGGRGFGAAGLGWDIPISYLERNNTFAHTRPNSEPGKAPVARERLTISLFSESVELVPRGDLWVARAGTLELAVRQNGASWLAYDWSGRTYQFSEPEHFSGNGLWLLKSVTAPGGAVLEITYQTNILPLVGSGGFEINLTRIAYNKHPTSWCVKNEIVLAYAPLSAEATLSVLGDKIMTRRSVVEEVAVMSRATCGAEPEKVRSYKFSYHPDQDTKVSRLMEVRLFGRQNTPEATVSLPVGSFTYGAASKEQKLTYQKTQSLPLPANVDVSNISASIISSSPLTPDNSIRYSQAQSLIDISGDGRPDFLFSKFGKFWFAPNRPGPGGETTFTGQQAVELFDATSTLGSRLLSTHGSLSRRYWYYTLEDDPATTTEDATGVRVSANHNIDNTWRQLIDVNGDGRLDLIDAAEEKYHWVVYLNTPSGSGVKWERRSFWVKRLGEELKAHNHILEKPEHVPLARRSSSGDVLTMRCWQWDGQRWKWWSEGVTTGQCRFRENPAQRRPEKTITEWELMDVNGDGYLDFIFNSSPVAFQVSEPTRQGTTPGEKWIGMEWAEFSPHKTNEVRVSFNVSGLSFDEHDDPFSKSVTLTRIHGEDGISLWLTIYEDELPPFLWERQVLLTGFADINGDGLADRFVPHRALPGQPSLTNVAYIGTYKGPQMFSEVSITLPGRLAMHGSQRRKLCATQNEFNVRQGTGMRDLTGDGIPDYYSGKQIWIGTSAGFASPIDIDIDIDGDFVISSQIESCDGKSSKTTAGLFDIDGDGKPDSVKLAGNNLDVYQLAGGSGRGVPEAGRLTSLDNGYGAKTNIAYMSAKEDPSSPHQLPFPEIVVSSVEITDKHGLGGKQTGGRYAYGNAELIYDSVLDRFTFPGYQRFVELAMSRTRVGSATVTDTWPLTEFKTSLTREERWLRINRVGKPRDIYKVRVAVGDPWRLLHVDADDDRVAGVTHFDWGAKFYNMANSDGPSYWCLDMVTPYDYAKSFIYNLGPDGLNACRSHGFTFVLLQDSWYGSERPRSPNNVQTRSHTRAIDDFGRVTFAEHEGDVHRGEDNFCVENNFAIPANNSYPRVLTALASRRTRHCSEPITYTSDSFQYDGLAVGSIGEGKLTSHFMDYRATDTGEPIRSNVRKFEADYDGAGNVSVIRTQREGVLRSFSFNYDEFGLVRTNSRIEAQGMPVVATSTSYDAVSLQPLSATDANQTQRGADVDGFGRLIRSTIKPPGGTVGVLSTVAYAGFEGTDPHGRRVTVKEFPNAVPPGSVDGSPGRTGIVFLDELGRARRTEVFLGSDYGNQKVVVGARIYDNLGRVAFEADPYPHTEDPATVYGTSFYFTNTGEIECMIRGRGLQPLNKLTDPSVERFPTCFERSFSRHTEAVIVRDATSLQPGTPQYGVVKGIALTALGQVIEQSTSKGSERLDHVTVSYDRLGRQISMTRFLDPAGGTKPVQWWRRLDSAGQMLEFREPDTAVRTFSYSDWGELVETQWADYQGDRRLVNKYDAFGRLTFAAETTNGITDPDTVKRYTYDAAITVSPHVRPTNVLGRLTSAVSKSGQVAFSYDANGRINARSFTDSDQGLYIQKSQYLDDGSLDSLEFNLPDQGYAPEVVRYQYDSAGRLKRINHSDSAGSRRLYEANFDPLGHVVKAQHGNGTTYEALYEQKGRRQLRAALVKSNLAYRLILLGVYDSLNRETSRVEIKDGVQIQTDVSYDTLGRVSSTKQKQGVTTLSEWKFKYDALGNVLRMEDVVGNADAALSYKETDPDRVCHVGYDNEKAGGCLCNVTYDALGNVVSQRTRKGERQLQYFASGGIRSIDEQGSKARFAYDAFGRVQQLDVVGNASEKRRDRRYGRFIERRDITLADGSTSSYIFRQIPGPGGIVASRRGTRNSWVYEFGERRGNRFFTDDDGAFVQEVNYRPFGEANSSGAEPGAANYTSYQWNGRDTLAAFGLSHLGARVYDPSIGRFLSRDPIRIPRSSARTNPYAFASNDPVNSSDPTGLDEDVKVLGDVLSTSGGVLDGVDLLIAPGQVSELFPKVTDKTSRFRDLPRYIDSDSFGPMDDLKSGVGLGLKVLGTTLDVAGVALKTAQYANNPTWENFGELGREVAETVVSATPGGFLIVWGIKSAEWGVGKLVDHFVDFPYEDLERKLEADMERYAKKMAAIKRDRLLRQQAAGLAGACGSIFRPAECAQEIFLNQPRSPSLQFQLGITKSYLPKPPSGSGDSGSGSWLPSWLNPGGVLINNTGPSDERPFP